MFSATEGKIHEEDDEEEVNNTTRIYQELNTNSLIMKDQFLRTSLESFLHPKQS